MGNEIGYRTIGSILLAVLLSGCSASPELHRREVSTSSIGITVIPSSYYAPYYTTKKARDLSEKYSHNLDQLETQVAHSSVGKLTLENDIVVVGMGFFTHSAAGAPDERYLEVIVDMPDILNGQTDLRKKVDRFFTQHGFELLSILAGDPQILDDKEIAGYGLNFSWRSITQTASGFRLILERAVIYVPKTEARRFLARQIDQRDLLGSSTVFAQGEGPAKQIAYPPPAHRSIETAKPVDSHQSDLSPRAERPSTDFRRREEHPTAATIIGEGESSQLRMQKAITAWLMKSSRQAALCSSSDCSPPSVH